MERTASRELKILGWQVPFTKAQAAPLPPQVRPDQMTGILPPFGSNPPPLPIGQTSDLLTRQIQSDPRELWYLALPSKLKPNVVEMILRSAAGGDIWQQWQLFTRMLDSWPMLRKCCHELQSAIAQTKYTVRPFALIGKEPTRSAVEKADFCSSLIQQMKPDPITDEKGFYGMVYHLTNAFLNGISMVEILWERDRSGWEMHPRATAFVHPRHYTFTTGGKIVLAAPNYQRYAYPNPNQFITAQYSGHSGSCLTGGILRPLAWPWSAIMYNREWMLEFAQRFGQPFRWATYKPNTPTDEIKKINENLANMGASAWASFVEGAVMNFQAPGTLGPQQPQMAIQDMADKYCQLLILGQTLTTDVGDSGSRALGDVHESVRRERVEELAKWVGQVLSEQFLPAILRTNYNDDSECPTIEPEFTQAEDPLKTAQRFQILMTLNLPLNREQVYRELDLELPEEGDPVVVGGRLGVLGPTDEEISAVPVVPEPTPNEPTDPEGNGDPNGKPNGNGNRLTASDYKALAAIYAKRMGMAGTDLEPKKKEKWLNAKLDKLRTARLKAFAPLLEKITALEKTRDAEDFKNHLLDLKSQLTIFAEEAHKNHVPAQIVEEMLAEAFQNGMLDKFDRQKKILPS